MIGLEKYLSMIESLGKNCAFKELYLWPNTPIQRNLQDEILQKCGASDYEINNPFSRTYKVTRELTKMIMKGAISEDFSILDIACGDAVVLTQIKELYVNCDAYGLDCYKDKFETHKDAYKAGCKIFCGYIQHLLNNPPQGDIQKTKFDIVVMFNTYRGWKNAELREEEKELPNLADKYFAENAQYTFLTVTEDQIQHLKNLGFYVKILGKGERDSIMILISKKKQFVFFNDLVLLKCKIVLLKNKIKRKILKNHK
jgi:hypothetical protein